MLIKITLYVLSMILLLNIVQGSPIVPKTYRPRYNPLPFEDCGSTFDLMYVQISSCTTAPCTIPVNNTVTVTAEFATKDSTNVLTHEANWILQTINTKAVITPDACDGRSCPFKAPDGFAFAVDLKVNAYLPTVRGTLYWRSRSVDGKLVMCFKVPIAVTLST